MSANGREYLIVDGHSVIFSWPELLQLHTRKMILARERLATLLTEYQDATGVKVVLVFDGAQTKTDDASNPAGIQIFYSASNRTADDIIERLVAKYGTTHQITVATSDLLEQQTVITFGASCVSAEGLRGLLKSGRDELDRRLRTHKKKR